MSRYMGEDYVDFIIDTRTNLNISELFPNAVVHKINNTYSILHLPVSQFDDRLMRGARLLLLPTVFGLTSEAALDASGVDRIRSLPDFNLRGGGTLIAIIDTGINYALPVFKKPDGTTKIHSIWDQNIQSGTAPFELNFGSEYSMNQINQAISSQNSLDVVPSMDENGHGTMLAAVAAGTQDSSAGFSGVAPDAELVIVKLAQAKRYLRDFYSIPEGVVCYQENHIMWGVQYCLLVSRQMNKPIIICMGLGTSQSSHDGTAPLSIMLSDYADYPHIGIVMPAGNEGNLGRHFFGRIDPAIGKIVMELDVGESDKGFSMCLWGSAPGIYSIDIISPSGEYIPRIPASLQVSRRITFIFEETIIYIEYQTVELGTGDQLIMLNFKNTAAGTWRFTVYAQGDLVGEFHVWLPMGDFITRETHFLQPDIYTTVLTPGNAYVPITVTAYNPIGGALYVNASRGYTRSNVVQPELAAPGVNYIAPALNGGYTNYTGSGVASAHTAGIVALLMEWGVVRGNQTSFDTVEIKKYLIRGAERSENLTYPNREWGYGVLNLFNTFDVLRQNA